MSFIKLSHYTTTVGLNQVASLSNSSVMNSRSCIFSASSPILPLVWEKDQEGREEMGAIIQICPILNSGPLLAL